MCTTPSRRSEEKLRRLKALIAAAADPVTIAAAASVAKPTTVALGLE
jgi:hypothetical protein